MNRRRFRRSLFRAIPGLSYEGAHWIIRYEAESGVAIYLEGPRRQPALAMHAIVKEQYGGKSVGELRALEAGGGLSRRRREQLRYYERRDREGAE